jgi:predicted small metal-binding protein
MKQFFCGDVVPGCAASFHCDTESQILDAVAQHASRDHGIQEISPALLAQVRSHIHDAPAA